MNAVNSTFWQKFLLITLYGLILLMVIFSLLAIKNKGQAGYDSCIKQKCQEKGEQFCAKSREINNCCRGAGGEIEVVNNQLSCRFK